MFVWVLLHIVYKILCIADHEILISSSQELCRYEGNICLIIHLMQLKKVGEGHNYNMHVYIMKKVMVMLPYFRKKCAFEVARIAWNRYHSTHHKGNNSYKYSIKMINFRIKSESFENCLLCVRF